MLISNEDPLSDALLFVEKWFPELTDQHRIWPGLIPGWMPLPLQKVFEFAGNYPIPNDRQWRSPSWIGGLFSIQDKLLPIHQMQPVEGRFEFIRENQGVWSCETIAREVDPPVFSNADSESNSDLHYDLVCSSLSRFLTTFCLQEIFFRSGYVKFIDSEIQSPNEITVNSLQNLWVNGPYVFKYPTHSFYLCENRLLIMKSYDWYWFGYNEPDAIELIEKRLEYR